MFGKLLARAAARTIPVLLALGALGCPLPARDNPCDPRGGAHDCGAVRDSRGLDQAQPDGSRKDAPGTDKWGKCSPPAATQQCANGWCKIPPGCFRMGSPMNETCRNNSEDQHEVVLNHAFLISEVEVTRTQFESVMLHPPSAPRYACGAPSNETCPEGPVSWQEAVAYCNKLSDMEQFAQCYVLASVAGVCASCPGDSGCVNGVCVTVTVSPSFRGGNSTIYDCPGYRLPTEAEWEYAYRAGTSTPYYNGPSDPAGCPKNEAGAVVCGPEYAVASDIAWWCRNSGSKLHEVGQKLPNGWGLHDLAGNAREWVHDGYVPHLGSLRQTDPVVDPTLTTPMAIVQRGGSSGTGSHALRAASRTFSAPVLPNILPTPQGFRCARTLEP